MKRLLQLDDVRALLRRVTNGHPVQWAREHKVSPSYLANVLAGRATPGPAILRALNLRKVVYYERVKVSGVGA